MSKSWRLTGLLLASSALAMPAVVLAQTAPSMPPSDNAKGDEAMVSDQATPDAQQADNETAQPDISIPGAMTGQGIVVTGERRRNIEQVATQVVSVLSSADIARTGEGDIAGALGHVPGLSVVGNGFVYVRGLGDRYSLALLNGSPLPSPEPLKRVVPLDLFPASIIASSLVQKSYSVNFPGEFGGGVINLTTKAVPEESFLTFGGGIGIDSETTNQLGYTYYGSKTDWTGFDNGNRDLPPALADYLSSGQRLSQGIVDGQAIASQLVTGRNAIVQRNSHLPPNVSASITGGTSFELGGDTRLGIIASASYGNKWRTRDALQQTSNAADLSSTELNFQRVITDDRIVVNGLLGLGLEMGDNKIRLTNLYIRDTLKQARLGVGQRQTTSPTATLMQQDTAWYERQLIDSQLTGEFNFKGVSIDVRGGYANSQREAPNEFSFEYYRSNSPTDPLGQYFINRLNNGQNGSATVSYSDLNENLWSAGSDIGYRFSDLLAVTIGYAYSDTQRRTEVREFQFTAPSDFPIGVSLFRPDLLLEPAVINAFNVALIDTNEANPVFLSKLRTNAGYGQVDLQFTPALSLNAGVRYESANQSVTPVQVFDTPTASLAGTKIDRAYWLPAATVTWEFAPEMQLRLSGSKTIARPQFRELVFQTFFDPESNRQYQGNPLLTDSQLYNAEARYEYYFARDQHVALAGFYKRLDNPIETYSTFSDNTVITSFANAPRANLYGVELEVQKYVPLETLGSAFAARRLVLIGNYTYTKSKLLVRDTDPLAIFAFSANKATDVFRDGAPLTGQSDHIANIQIGLEDEDRLSQQTFLISYASPRVTSRGASLQPDIQEKPGLTLDFVARQGFDVLGRELEIKFEARNITGQKYQEYQQSGDNIIYFNRYKLGTTISLSASIKL